MAEIFSPEKYTDEILKEFNDFIGSFHYIYEAKLKPGWKKDANAEEIKDWKAQNMKKVFLGLHASRMMQRIYEQVTTEAERDTITFDQMVQKCKTYFKGNTNTTLSNYKYHKLTQHQDESFDAFALRVKEEATNCSFKCTAAGCSVMNTLIRDRLIIGTTNDDIRRNALKDQWDLDDLIKNGRSLETATLGAEKIKTDEKPSSSKEIFRTKPGRYSGKANKPFKSKPKWTPNQNFQSTNIKCKFCNNPKCHGDKNCKGKKVECFACGLQGHFQNSAICKKTKQPRSTRKVQFESDTEHSTDDGEDTNPSDSDESTGMHHKVKRIFSNIPTIRKVAGCRRKITVRKIEAKYVMDVIIKEKPVKIFADTGAEVSIMSSKTARKLKLNILPTNMRIKPYGSTSKACLGIYIGTIMYKEAVVNAEIYIIDKNVETLLSGPVCEELGILQFSREASINKVEGSPDKERLVKKFPTIFSGKVGVLEDYTVQFHIDETVPPVVQPARPVPFHLRDKLSKELQSMEESGIIEEHHGPAPWVSNLVVGPKGDDIRVTVDMRNANKAIKMPHIPIPTPEEVRSRFAGYTTFSKLDFKSAFHQLQLDEPSKLMTVFHANGKLMRYCRLTMGSCPATGELTRALRPLFADCPDVHVIHDDLIVAGKTKAEHDAALEEACRRIEEAGMTLNPDKCMIAQSSIPWWGMTVSKDGVLPDPKKIEAMKHITPPKNKDELRSYLCMIQANKDFIHNVSRRTSNMRRLLKKHSKFRWTDACKQEFEDLKTNFKADTLLQHFDPKLKTFIHVDAHVSGISAILTQGATEENAKVVALASRCTTPTEARYPQLDLEAMAVDYGLRRFRYYIAGGPQVPIITDHKPLESILKNIRKGSIRTERIKLRHQDVDYKVIWRKGSSNITDFLSRHATPLNHLTQEERDEASELEKTIWFLQFSPYTESIDVSRLVESTNKCHILKNLKRAIQRGFIKKSEHQLKQYTRVFDKLATTDSGLIMKDDKLVIPKALIKTAIRKAHQGGHPGMTSMKRRLRSHFWHPDLNTSIEDAVRSCEHCLMFTNKFRKN